MASRTPNRHAAREINPFGVRMPADLKAALAREADINGRSLNQELIVRLEASLKPPGHNGAPGMEDAARQAYGIAPELSDSERAMLTVFRRLPPEKQLALLSLFK